VTVGTHVARPVVRLEGLRAPGAAAFAAMKMHFAIDEENHK